MKSAPLASTDLPFNASGDWIAARSGLLERAAFALTCGSAIADLFSIAVCHILLALAVVTLLVSGAKLRFPPIWVPLGLFVLGTALSMALSVDPASGRAQIRKLFVYLILFAIASTFRRLAEIRFVVLAWVGVGAFSAVLSLGQFANRIEQARRLGADFYTFYVGQRITGFMSHWMTFGGQMMIVLLLLAAFVLFAPQPRRREWRWLVLFAAAVISCAIVLGGTRSIWAGAGIGGLYLLWCWRRWVALVAPVVVILALAVGPEFVRARVMSAFRPHGDTDSNQHRAVTWRTGVAMIQANPWLGLGPEQVNHQFKSYVPADVPQPLPSGWYGHLHNIYLHYAAERGIPTLLALLWMLGQIAFDFSRALRRLPADASDAKFILHGAIAVLLGILVEGFFELNLGDSEVLLMFLTVVAFGYLAVERGREAEASARA